MFFIFISLCCFILSLSQTPLFGLLFIGWLFLYFDDASRGSALRGGYCHAPAFGTCLVSPLPAEWMVYRTIVRVLLRAARKGRALTLSFIIFSKSIFRYPILNIIDGLSLYPQPPCIRSSISPSISPDLFYFEVHTFISPYDHRGFSQNARTIHYLPASHMDAGHVLLYDGFSAGD